MASISEELERLFGLFEKGAITREQFEAKRDRLMAEDEAASTRRTSASSPGTSGCTGTPAGLSTASQPGPWASTLSSSSGWAMTRWEATGV